MTVPADAGREHAGFDGGEDLGRQAVEADVRRPVAGGPVAMELGLLRLRQYVEAKPEIGLVGEAVYGRRPPPARRTDGAGGAAGGATGWVEGVAFSMVLRINEIVPTAVGFVTHALEMASRRTVEVPELERAAPREPVPR